MELGDYHFPELIQFLCFGPNLKVVYLLSALLCFSFRSLFLASTPSCARSLQGCRRVWAVCVSLKSLVRSLSIAFPLYQLKEAFQHHLTLTPLNWDENVNEMTSLQSLWYMAWQRFKNDLFNGARSLRHPEYLMNI